MKDEKRLSERRKIIKQINKFHKNGSKTLCSDYLNYRSEGGGLSPIAWNNRIKEMEKEQK